MITQLYFVWEYSEIEIVKKLFIINKINFKKSLILNCFVYVLK